MTFAGTRLMKVKIGAAEYNATLLKAVIASGAADADTVTFADAAAGGAREYKLNGTGKADYAASTLWDTIFSAAGSTVAVVFNPYGVTTFTAATPGFSFNAVVTEPDGDFIGSEADPSATKSATFDFSWVLTAKPARLITGTY